MWVFYDWNLRILPKSKVTSCKFIRLVRENRYLTDVWSSRRIIKFLKSLKSKEKRIRFIV